MIQGKISEQVLARYPTFLTDANQRMSEPWFSADEHTHERLKFKAKLSAEILNSFRGRRYDGVGLMPVDFMISHEEWVRLEIEANVNPRAINANYVKNLRQGVFHFFKELFYKAQDFPVVDKSDLVKLIVDEQPFGADRVVLEVEGEKLPISIFRANGVARNARHGLLPNPRINTYENGIRAWWRIWSLLARLFKHQFNRNCVLY